MITKTNGYLVGLIESASKDTAHPLHGDAMSCLSKFRALEDTFFEQVHPQVDVGLAMHEVQLAAGQKPNIFTGHGCRHISDLVKSLDKLALSISSNGQRALDVFEAYLLLCAAHVHDAANVDGRRGHASRCNELIQTYQALFYGTVARQQVYEVASVHGGDDPHYGKDTLRRIEQDNSQEPRLPMLAALLRIGDELSENEERVPELLRKHHQHSDESKIAFAYAKSFKRFELRKDTLYLTYGVYPSEASARVRIDGQEIGFFDFLESKLDVIDREARYCSQYGRPDLHFGQIFVHLNVYESNPPSQPVKTLRFGWPLNVGYPSSPESICVRSETLQKLGHKTLAACVHADSSEKPNEDSSADSRREAAQGSGLARAALGLSSSIARIFGRGGS